MRVCIECQNSFNPSSRHRQCPSCRNKRQRKVCACGNFMGKASKTCHKCADRAMENNSNWRGGTVKHHNGYVMVRTPSHPRAPANNGYVFEHVLVMEEFLGRNLVLGENVHHINGVKDDNQLKNLELWCKPQPAGIRAEDAYSHAKEIVARYAPLFEQKG